MISKVRLNWLALANINDDDDKKSFVSSCYNLPIKKWDINIIKMESLEQIKDVANNLKTGSAKAVRALHKVIFEQEDDRSNRKRLREFKGFPFAVDSEEFTINQN